MSAFLSLLFKFLIGVAIGAAVSLAIYPRMHRNSRRRALEGIPEMEERYRGRVRELDEQIAALNIPDSEWQNREMHIQDYFTPRLSLSLEDTLKRIDEY